LPAIHQGPKYDPAAFRQCYGLLAYIKQYAQLAPLVRVEITAIINQLRSEGLGVSVDDFGAGYTLLAMLKDFTIDEIKIDRSFVSDMETEAQLQQLAPMGIGALKEHLEN